MRSLHFSPPSAVARAALLATLAGCSSTAAAPSDGGTTADAGATDGAQSPTDEGGAGDGGPAAKIRGLRYCEILLVTLNANGAHVDVYSTFGLNDCPEATWSAVDATKVAAEQAVSKAVLNGPRYWTLDHFVNASLVDPTPRTVGGLPMRHAGSIDVPTAALGAFAATPYAPNTVQRTTTVQLDAGKSVYELVGPDGKIYDMQSYSVQKTAQTEADLATLGARLTLPAGWTYRTRTLTANLQITALGGLATVLQDDFANTYQLSQQ